MRLTSRLRYHLPLPCGCKAASAFTLLLRLASLRHPLRPLRSSSTTNSLLVPASRSVPAVPARIGCWVTGILVLSPSLGSTYRVTMWMAALSIGTSLCNTMNPAPIRKVLLMNTWSPTGTYVNSRTPRRPRTGPPWIALHPLTHLRLQFPLNPPLLRLTSQAPPGLAFAAALPPLRYPAST